MSWFNRSTRQSSSTGGARDLASASNSAAQLSAAPATDSGISQAVLEVLPMIAFVVDASSLVVTGSSRSAFESGLVIGDRVVAPELLDLAQAARGAGKPVDLELTIARSPLAGGDLLVQARAASITANLVLVMVNDLTIERNVEAMRRDFVVNVSHELKTPVGALGLLAEAILADVEDSEQVRHFAERIEHESTRLAHLIGDIVELSRLQGDDLNAAFEPVQLQEVVDLAVDAVAAIAEAKEISLVTPDRVDVVVEGTKSQLVAAVRNLLANAVAYSPENTRVAIGVQHQGGIATIVVADQGQGIPEQDLDRIFERFYRVDQARSRSTGGTGLGLSIVKHICLNHGGDVTVRSIEGEGSTFSMRIPRVQTPSNPQLTKGNQND